MLSTKIIVLGDSMVAELTQSLLGRTGCQVTVANSEQDALDRLKTEQFDLLILHETLPGGRWGYDFLADWRARAGTTDVLTLMTTGKSGYQGIVRAPAYMNQAHAYIPIPFLPENFIRMVSNLLGGASTQHTPGEEGFVRLESKELGISFNHPVFWEVGTWHPPEATRTFRRSGVVVTGPLNRNQSLYSAITVALYSSKSADLLQVEDIVAFEFKAMQSVSQVREEHVVQVAGLEAKEAEYIWSAEDIPTHRHSMWRQQGEQGRSICTMVNRKGRAYVLSLTAADKEFEDFRPAYAELLRSFSFLA